MTHEHKPDKRLDDLKDKLTIEQISQYTGYDIPEIQQYYKKQSIMKDI